MDRRDGYDPAMQRPDVLVLGAGGTIGAAWMAGVLTGIADETGVDFATVDHLVGTSAGAMLAADLLAGVEPRAPAPDSGLGVGHRATAHQDAPAGEGDGREGGGGRGARLARALTRPLAPLALSLARPGGALVRAAALARIEPPRASLDDLGARIARHGLSFDGRLRVVCVDRARGRRVVFGAPGGPPATVAEAVQASCSVPWTHGPVEIGGREYVDGGVWSPTNMDAAPALRETHLLCLAPLGGPLGEQPRHPALRAGIATAIGLESAALRRRGVILDVLVPEPADAGEHARLTGYRQGRALAATSR